MMFLGSPYGVEVVLRSCVRAWVDRPWLWLCGLILVAAVAPAAGAAPLRFEVNPFIGALELERRFSPLVRYLEGQIGVPIELRISPDYESHIEAVGSGEVDIAFLGPRPYVELTARYGAFPLLARYEIDGKGFYHGVIVVPAKSDLQRLTDLRGRRFAFGDHHSTMSTLVPHYLLLQAGIHEEDLGEAAYLNNHENIALGVLMGRFDAGAMMESVYQSYRGRGLRILERSPPFSEHLLVAAQGTDPQRVAALRRALFALGATPEGAAILHGLKPSLTAFGPVEDRDYDGLREILRRMEGGGP